MAVTGAPDPNLGPASSGGQGLAIRPGGKEPPGPGRTPAVVPSHRRPGIRLDRVSRLAFLVVTIAVLALYVGPLHSYFTTQGEAAERRAAVAELRQENRELRARRAALKDDGALEQEARKLGMVRPGERSYVLRGLPGE